jgi:glycosyltransferase involved in cell wall biosynthesis
MRENRSKPRVLVFIVAYNAEKTIGAVIGRIPGSLSNAYDIHVLIVDDASHDSTFAKSYGVSQAENLAFPIHILFNPVNLGYGGNQKLGYHYAIENGFDFVVLLHGDGEYAPERLPDLLEPLRRGEADAVFGSRMMAGKGMLAAGMPLYKFLGNKCLTWIENHLLHAKLSEFHSGYRVYSVAALRSIPFGRNSNDFHFDTEIVIQLLIAGRPIAELPIPPYHGGEIRRLNGVKYAANVLMAAFKARLQEASLFYDRRFDCAPPQTYSPYTPKFDYESTHTIAIERILPGSRVLELGCAGGYLGSRLRERKHCFVVGMDLKPVKRGALDRFESCDLNAGAPRIDAMRYDFVLMLDVIEHLNRPEVFLEDLRRKLALNPSLEFMISTANVAFFVTRAMLLLGWFNYGPRGILDVTHTRLFTFASLRRALVQAGFDVLDTKGVPAPYPLAIGDNLISRALLVVNHLLIRISRGLFSYQILMRVKAQPTVELLLATAERQSSAAASLIETGSVEAGANRFSLAGPGGL